MKIYIFGGPTTGKTTFSKKLSKKYNIKYLPLDKIIFKKGNIRRKEIIRNIKRHVRERKFSLLSTFRLCFILLPRYYSKYIRDYAESHGAINVVVIKNPTLKDLVDKIKIFYDN